MTTQDAQKSDLNKRLEAIGASIILKPLFEGKQS
jgi:hypothetical protein